MFAIFFQVEADIT